MKKENMLLNNFGRRRKSSFSSPTLGNCHGDAIGQEAKYAWEMVCLDR